MAIRTLISMPWLPPGYLPKSGIEPRYPALLADSLPSEPPGKPFHIDIYLKCKWIGCSKQKTLTGWLDTKTRPILCCLQKTHFRPRDTCRLKARGWKKLFHANGNQKKAGIAIFISDKLDFKDCCKTQGRTLHNHQWSI